MKPAAGDGLSTVMVGPSEIPYDLPVGSSGRAASRAVMSSIARLSSRKGKSEISANDAPASQGNENKLPRRRANIVSPPAIENCSLWLLCTSNECPSVSR